MTRLYQKSPLLFALLWIAVYVVGFSAADSLSLQIGQEKLITVILGAILSAVLLGWLKKQDLFRFYGLTKPTLPAGKMLYYWPLAAMVAVNLWQVHYGSQWYISVILSRVCAMIFVGILEEVIFRGLLFRAMARDHLKAAVIVSSITFGLGHIVNLLNGAPLFTTLLQIVYAAAAGFLFTIIFLKTGSIVPCILCHCFVNAVGVLPSTETSTSLILLSLALTALSAVYAWWICKYHPENRIETL